MIIQCYILFFKIMFIYPQTTGISLSKFRQGLKYEKKFKNRIKDPNQGLDYASSVNYVQPMFKEKFQSDKFVKDLLQKCKNNQKKINEVIDVNKNQKQTKNIATSLGVKRISNNSPLIQNIFKIKSKVRKRIISKAKTETVSFQNDFIDQQTKKSFISFKKQNKSLFDQTKNKNLFIEKGDVDQKFVKYPERNQFVLSSKKLNNNYHNSEANQDIQSLKDSQGSKQNEQIILKSTFLKNKKFIRNKQNFFRSDKNSLNQNSLNSRLSRVKTAQFSRRHKFKPNKTQLSNQVAFIKRKSDFIKLNPQNINEFVQQVIENYGNKFMSTNNEKLIEFTLGRNNLKQVQQRKFRNKTQNSSSENSWSRNSIAKQYNSKNANRLTMNSFYPKRSSTQQSSNFIHRKIYLQNKQNLQQRKYSSLKTIT